MYNIHDIQRELGIGRDELIAYAFLLGSDYAEGVKGVGIVNATEIIEAFVKSDVDSTVSVRDDLFFGETAPLLDSESQGVVGMKEKRKSSQLLDQKQMSNSSDYITKGLMNFKSWLDQYAVNAVSSELGRELDTTSVKDSVVSCIWT